MNKPRVIKDYDKLEVELQEQIKLAYPRGFEKNLVKFRNREGNMVSALPFEAEEKYYLVRMTVVEAREIIEDDDDYNDSGVLKGARKNAYEDKFSDEDDDDLGDDLEGEIAALKSINNNDGYDPEDDEGEDM